MVKVKKNDEKTFTWSNEREGKKTKGEWLIGVHIQNIIYLSIVTTQHKTRERRVRCLLVRIKARINDWQGVQGV